MAFDWTKVEGYRDDMTADEKLGLLDNYEMPTDKTNPEDDSTPAPAPSKPSGAMVSKTLYDKVSSELAATKKQLRSRMSDDENREADRQAAEADMRAELDQLRKEKALSNYKASYLAQGYNEALADEAATAMVDGDMDGVFAVMKKHSAEMEKTLRAKILKDTPVPPAGNEPDEKKKEQQEIDSLRRYMGLSNL